MTMTAEERAGTELKDGRVVAIAGPVVDVEFPPDALPEINHAIDMAELVAEDQDGVDCSAEAEAAREAILMDEDVLLFWMPNAEAAFAGGAMHDALPDLPSTDPARWFDRFVTTGEDRAEP